MQEYPSKQWERIMRIQDVFYKAKHKSITWKEAAQLLGVTERTLRRWKHTVSEDGFSGLLDHRTRRPSPKRAPQRLRDQVKLLYKDLYWQWNVKHFHEQLHKHNIPYSYSWTKNLLQQNKLVTSKPKRSKHRKKRPRRPLVGMMLHIDGSDHCWIPHLTQQRQDLICVMDDANNYVYYAKLVPEENSLECMRALKHVVSTKGIFCSLYSDRASHFFVTPNSGKKVDLSNMTQIGRACYELGIQMIPAYSPQARGRSERLFGTWQGRLPQELELLQIRSVEEANQYICESFLPWHNQNLLQTPADEASAFCSYQGRDLDRIFSIKEARVVNHDNTVQYKKLLLQIEPCDFRISFAKCKVIVHQHIDLSISVQFGPHVIGRYDSRGQSLVSRKSPERKSPKADCPSSHLSTKKKKNNARKRKVSKTVYV